MRPVVAVLLASLCTSAGCRDPEPGAAEEDSRGDGCDYEDREVSLDAEFADETPRQVIALLERPVDGHITWRPGNGEHVDVGGVTGESEFHAQASFVGPAVWVREGIEGKGGVLEERIFCPTHLLFDVAVEIETEDGALAETWSGRADYEVSGMLGGIGSIRVTVDAPRPFAGSLTVTERPAVVAQWETHELSIALFFVTHPPDMPAMHGAIRYHLANDVEGEVEGVTVTVAELSRVE